MATCTCPKCKKDSFSWSIDEEESNLMKWGCFECGYVAFEDETNEKICDNCKRKSNILLMDNKSKYWWCSSCNSIT